MSTTLMVIGIIVAFNVGFVLGAAWCSAFRKERETGLVPKPGAWPAAPPLVCCRELDSNGLPRTLTCNPECYRRKRDLPDWGDL